MKLMQRLCEEIDVQGVESGGEQIKVEEQRHTTISEVKKLKVKRGRLRSPRVNFLKQLPYLEPAQKKKLRLSYQLPARINLLSGGESPQPGHNNNIMIEQEL